MRKIIYTSILLFMTVLASELEAAPKGAEAIVKFETSEGAIRIKLYNETPLHRDNFIKLVENGTFNDLLFHRVIKGFMVQGGDPQSKGAPQGRMLGTGDVGYTVPAEFAYPQLFHKRGALSAARQGDDRNPKKASSGCQFYIVWGEKLPLAKIDAMEMQMYKRREQQLFNQLTTKNRDEIMNLRRAKNQEGLMALQEKMMVEVTDMMQKEIIPTFTPEQRKAYSEEGGTPHLDGEYTVFGEVIEGLDVVEKIQLVKTDRNDRPEKDIKFTAKMEYKPTSLKSATKKK